MVKHNCPYCADVHLDTSYLQVDLAGKEYELSGLICPKCKAELFLAQEVRNFLNSKST